MKAYLIAATMCIAMPAFAQGTDKAAPNAPSAAAATTAAGVPTGPATSQGSADHKGDSAGNTGQSTGPGTNPDHKAIAEQKKAHPEGSGQSTPQ